MFQKLTGLIAATHTPFHADGALNLEAIPRQAEHLIASGVRAAFIGGSTGEFASLTVEERLVLTRRWMDVVRGTSLPVIVHVGHNCQADAATLACEAGQAEAQGVAALAPSYFKPGNVKELIRFLAPVAGAAPDLPFYFYDIPSMTGVSLSMTEFLQQAPQTIPNLAGIKYTNVDPVQLQECLQFQRGRFDILFGMDEALLSGLALGTQGAVGSSYNFAAAIYHRVMEAFRKGDWETARVQQGASIALIRLLGRYGYLPAAKHVMSLLGVPVGPARSPLPLLDDVAKAALERELHDTGLWAELAR